MGRVYSLQRQARKVRRAQRHRQDAEMQRFYEAMALGVRASILWSRGSLPQYESKPFRWFLEKCSPALGRSGALD